MTEKRLDNQTREEIARINNCHIGSIVYYNKIIKFYKDILYVEMTEASKLKIVCIPDYDADEVKGFIENELVIGVEYEIVVEDTVMKTMPEKRFYCIDEEEYNSYWIADTSKVDKDKEDFYDEEEESYRTYEFEEYLEDNGAVLKGEEVVDLLNENQQLKKENHQLKHLIQAIISKEFEISSEDNDYDALTEFFKNEVSISQIEVDIDVEKEEREY